MRITRVCFTLAAWAAVSMPLIGATKPNILFIMVDDLGKEWVSCYGAEDIETPHIDALSAGGMTFANAYSMPQCTPSRVTLLTGKHHQLAEMPDWLDPKAPMLPRMLQKVGYVTGHFSKWHLTRQTVATTKGRCSDRRRPGQILFDRINSRTQGQKTFVIRRRGPSAVYLPLARRRPGR